MDVAKITVLDLHSYQDKIVLTPNIFAHAPTHRRLPSGFYAAETA